MIPERRRPLLLVITSRYIKRLFHRGTAMIDCVVCPGRKKVSSYVRIIHDVVVLTVLCATPLGGVAIPSEPLPSENYAIYSFIIRDMLANLPPQATIMVQNRTEIQPDDPSCLTEAEPVKRDHDYDGAIRSYIERNRLSKVVGRSVNLPVPYRIVEKPNQDGDLEKGHALFTVSDVGMNSAHDRSVVYVSLQCGNLCGRGAVYFLRKEDGVWHYDRGFGPPVCLWTR
jgi:hypothetical protein